MSTLLRKRRIVTLAASIGALCAAIAGCGGSSSLQSTVQHARPTPAGSNADIAPTNAEPGSQQHTAQLTSVPRGGRAQPGAVQPSPTVQRAKPTPAEYNDDARGAEHTQFNPCTLVSVSEAQTIVAGPIAGRVEAPLGPTCVYKLSGSKSEITLAVESLSFSQVTHQMKRRTSVTIGHHQAYCGRLGTDMLFVPLGRGQLLNVTAPCAIAPRFATLAVSRLAA
jgi:hypothetical protein